MQLKSETIGCQLVTIHNLAYMLALSPWRSIAWGIGAQTTLIVAGRCTAWLLPSAAISLQVIVNAPLLLQWAVGLGIFTTLREQQRRYDNVTQRKLLVGMIDDEPDDQACN